MASLVENNFDRLYGYIQERFDSNDVKMVVKEAKEWRWYGLASGAVAAGVTCALTKITYSYWPYTSPALLPLGFCLVIANDSYRWVKMTTRVIKAAGEPHEHCKETKNKAQWAKDVEVQIDRSLVFRSMFKQPLPVKDKN